MAEDTFVAFGATYDSVDDATTDFEAVRAAHQDLGLMDFYDAAVVAKDEDGTVRVVKKHETAEWVDGGSAPRPEPVWVCWLQPYQRSHSLVAWW